MAALQRITPGTSADSAMEILERDGALIYERLLDETVMDHIQAELDPYLGRAYLGEGEFRGHRTKRTTALVAKSRSVACEVVVNPQVLVVMDRLLGPRCQGIQLHVTQAAHIGPGEKGQILHRDDGLMPFVHPGPQALCNTMWALNDFTVENGATNVILGSHLWDDDRVDRESDEITHAAMPKGSCLIYVGSVWHGGGANKTTDTWRTGMICGYSLGWLRQEENQYLAVPPEVARTLPEAVQHLIGYKLHGIFLGWVEGQDPHVVLEDRYAEVMPAVAEGGEATAESRLLKTAVLGNPTFHSLG